MKLKVLKGKIKLKPLNLHEFKEKQLPSRDNGKKNSNSIKSLKRNIKLTKKCWNKNNALHATRHKVHI